MGIFSLIVPFNVKPDEIIKLRAKALILSGGPSSVYDAGSPKPNKSIFNLGVPILGVCYGMQLMVHELGGQVAESDMREYGLADLETKPSQLLKEVPSSSRVWMSHGDRIKKLPAGFRCIGTSSTIKAAIENKSRQLYGLQFHPEVTHTEFGYQILRRFIFDLAKLKANWNSKNFIRSKLDDIKQEVGDAKVVCALSGGVDSSVAASLVNLAIGDQQTCIFVDTGLLREGEYDEVLKIYKQLDLNVKPIKAARVFLRALKGVSDPERKRKIIGSEFIKIFQSEANKIKDTKFLVQGTLYPDVIESSSSNGPSANIKSHHNVGGLPAKMKLALIEPLRELFKDEVRLIGRELGLPEWVTRRQPFPGPGLAVRILGEVSLKSIKVLQAADAIVRQEIDESKYAKKLWQYFAVLLPIKSVGVMGDNRTFEKVIAIRAVESVDGMTANWAQLPHRLLESLSRRIVNEVPGVNRVVYDITSKPPGTIEWE